MPGGPLSLFIDVPICAFRPNWAREYQETYPIAPPATVFGMLLSLAGIDWADKRRFAGVRLALALAELPTKQRAYRKFRRVPQNPKKGKDWDPLTERRPDYQELLLDMALWVWLDDSEAKESLIERVTAALDPERRRGVQRYGGLSLGESSHLINEITIREPEGNGIVLRTQEDGLYQLPVWVDHPRSGASESRLQSFDLEPDRRLSLPEPEDPRWVAIRPRDH